MSKYSVEYIEKQSAIEAIRKAENHAFNSFYNGLVKAHKIVADLPSADVVPICQTGCKGCKREYNLVVGSCRLCARFYKDMYDGVE